MLAEGFSSILRRALPGSFQRQRLAAKARALGCVRGGGTDPYCPSSHPVAAAAPTGALGAVVPRLMPRSAYGGRAAPGGLTGVVVPRQRGPLASRRRQDYNSRHAPLFRVPAAAGRCRRGQPMGGERCGGGGGHSGSGGCFKMAEMAAGPGGGVYWSRDSILL